MPLFVMIGRDGPEGAARRKDRRPAHLAHLAPLADAGRVPWAGPLLDPTGAPCGSVVVFEAESLAAARAHAEADPYVSGGVFGSFEVFGTLRVFPEEDA